jgi:AraC-like DNA-binding protein
MMVMAANQFERGATSSIIGRFHGEIGPGAMGVVVAAAAIGWRRTAASELATVMHVSRRTLESRLVRQGLVAPVGLLAEMLCAHAVWHLELADWTAKRVASVAGFSGRNAFATFLKRRTGLTPTVLAATGVLSVLDGLPQKVLRSTHYD